MVEPKAASEGFFGNLKALMQGDRAYGLVNLANLTDGLAYFGIMNVLVLYLTETLKMSDERAHPVVTVFTGLVTLFMLTMGSRVDRWGTREALTRSLLCGFVGRTGLMIASFLPGPAQVPFAIGSLLVMALATGIFQPTVYAAVKSSTEERLSGLAFSLLYAIMNLGSLMGSVISPWIRTHEKFLGVPGLGLGFGGVIGFTAAVTLLQLVIHLIWFPRSEAPHLNSEELRPPTQEKGRHPLADFRFAFFIFILLPVRTLFAHQWLTLEPYALRCFPEVVRNHVEWLSSINTFVVMLFVPVVTHVTRHIPVLRMMIIGTLVSACSTFLLSLEPDTGRLIAYVAVFSLGEALWSSRFLEHVAAISPAGQVGAYMGVANLPWFLAKTTTGLYSGWMMAHFVPKEGPQHPEVMWAIYGAIALISPVGLLLASRWLEQIKTRDERSELNLLAETGDQST